MKNKILWLSLVVFVIILILASLTRKKKSIEQIPEETPVQVVEKNEVQRRWDMEKRIKSIDYAQYVKEALSVYFSSINSLSEVWYCPDSLKEKHGNALTMLVEARGFVNGKPKSFPKGKYHFYFKFCVEENNEDVLSSILHNTVSISHPGEGGDYIYLDGDSAKAQERNQRRKEWEKKKAEAAKAETVENDRNFMINGIRVQLDRKEGASLVFICSKELTAKQILAAIEKIGPSYGANMIQFCDDKYHFADYVYSTECIIFKGSNVIYKVIDGKPVRAN